MVRASDRCTNSFIDSLVVRNNRTRHGLMCDLVGEHLGVEAKVETQKTVIDPNVQWGKWSNIFKNARSGPSFIFCSRRSVGFGICLEVRRKRHERFANAMRPMGRNGHNIQRSRRNENTISQHP